MTVQERLKHFLENSGFISCKLTATAQKYTNNQYIFASDGFTFLYRWRGGENGCYFEYCLKEYPYIKDRNLLIINIL